MVNLFLNFLVFAYAATGVVATIGYFPTIRDLWHHKKMSANLNSYIIWTFTGGITFLYSLFILPNLLFRIVSGLSFACCAIILLLSMQLRYKSKKRHN